MNKPDTTTGVQLVKVPVARLREGMYVSKLDRPWVGTPFMFQGFPISGKDELRKLRNICDYVFVDVRKSKPADREIAFFDLADIKRTEYKLQVAVEQELNQAASTYKDTLRQTKSLLQDAKTHGEINGRKLKRNVKLCVDSVTRNPNALVWLTAIKHQDAYTLEHSVNVGVLAIALGRQLGLPRQQLETLGLCGMLHDVGKAGIDQAILNKSGTLTAEELEHIKSHVAVGRDMLLHDPLIAPEILEAVFSHHERVDGGGYPSGTSSEALSFYTRVITIVDAYDAMTSDRVYTKSISSTKALKILYNERGKQFDQQLVVAFIQCMGLYPPGCLVEMESGEVGLVIAADPHSRLQPKVALIRDKNKKTVQQIIVDLKKEGETGEAYKIKRALKDGSYGVSLEKITRENINIQMTLKAEQKEQEK
ncbi:MAG: HD-GYP domain-containing protein [Pseudomonadales bacterium]